MTEITKELSFSNYADIMTESIIFAAELTLLLPVAFENTISSGLTPWIRAGITNFSLCHVFDAELHSNCPSSLFTSSNSQYIATGTFEIAAMQRLNKYKSKIVDIFRSNDFLDSFTEQMNMKLGDYMSDRRRLISYDGFRAIQVDVVDPSGDTTTASPSQSTTAPVEPSETYQNSNEQSPAFVHADTSLLSGIIGVLVVMMVIMCIGFGFLYKYKTQKVESMEGMKRDIENARGEMEEMKEIINPGNDDSKKMHNNGANVRDGPAVTGADDYKTDSAESSRDSKQNLNPFGGPFEEEDTEELFHKQPGKDRDIVAAINETDKDDHIMDENDIIGYLNQ